MAASIIGVLKEFRSFLLRGNVLDLAVAVVIGAAFGAVVTSLVTDLITPLIAAVAGKPDFSDLTFTVNGSVFRYGSFLNSLIALVSIGAAIFFFIVKPVDRLFPKRVNTRSCPECLSEIPLEARRCAFCTAEVRPEAAMQ